MKNVSEIIVVEELLWALAILGFVVICLLIYLIISEFASKKKKEFEVKGEYEIPEREPEKEKEPKQEPEKKEPKTEAERLAQKEKELAEREEKVKAQRLSELEERAKVIERKKEEVASPKAAHGADLEAEKRRIQDMIRKAEDRYASGEISEENFKRIAADYQNRIIELDVKIRKQRKNL